jgi:hypothetical protein
MIICEPVAITKCAAFRKDDELHTDELPIDPFDLIPVGQVQPDGSVREFDGETHTA